MKNRRAQSLIELSLFGMVILSLLGVVLNYGMRYNFRQTAEQRAFRKAMAKAAGHMGPKTYILLHDRHIANPMDAFGTGQAAPTNAAASLTRDYRMLTTPEVGDPMPTMTIGLESGVGGTREIEFTTAKIDQYCWPEGGCDHRFARQKYEEVLGASNVWGENNNCVNVLDYCAGEIFDYEVCKKQCRMMEELDFCVRECQRGRLYHDDACDNICGTDVPAFWYCSSIDSFFSFTGSSDTRNWVPGIQPKMTIESIRAESMTKTESPGGISTSDTLSHTDNIIRTVVFRPIGSTGPSITEETNVVDRAPEVSMDEGW